MTLRSIVIAGLALLALITVSQSMFIVDQRQQAIVLYLGAPVREINRPGRDDPGLHFKTPFLETVVKLDRRNIALDAGQEEIIGADQQRLVVDAFIRYQIVEPLQFYRTLGDETLAQNRIERLVNSSLRQVLGTATQGEIVSGRRAELTRLALADVAKRTRDSRMGIRVIDLKIKRADLPTQNREFVYRRMQTSRQQEAARIRAEGEQKKREITAEADKEVTVTLATAREDAGRIVGEGDAQRVRIYAQSYGKDPSFAAFFRSMQAYDTALRNGETTLVLSPDSAFFRYFERGPTGGAGRR
jgi:membrane protease subunit HflC